MAYQDARLLLGGSISATDNSITAATGFAGNGTTVLSGGGSPFTGGNVIDLSIARDIGEGEDLYFRILLTAAVTGGTSMTFNLITASDAALSANVQVIASTGAIPVASLTINSRIAVELSPLIASKGQRYLGVQIINVGANAAGSAIIDIGKEIQDGQKFYASGFSVL